MQVNDLTAEELIKRYSSGERLFIGISLQEGSVLEGVNLEGSTFLDGFFSDINAQGVNLRGSIFKNMNLKCTDFRNADLTNALFDDVSVEHVAFKGAIVIGAEFKNMFYHGNLINEFDPDDWE